MSDLQHKVPPDGEGMKPLVQVFLSAAAAEPPSLPEARIVHAWLEVELVAILKELGGIDIQDSQRA